MEALILIVMMTGWLTLLFATGCALETALRRLRGRRTGSAAAEKRRASSPEK